MNHKSLIVLLAMCLTACATPSVRDESPASDLDALVSSVGRDLRPTKLPNGREYCAELARTERDKDECTGDLEDALFTANMDKGRALQTLRKAVERLRLARAPCRFYQLSCKRREKALDAP